MARTRPLDETWFLNSLRDKAGNLWFGTSARGVNRYEAATGTFTHFTEADGLCGNAIADIYEDRAGQLWFATNKCICRYVGKSFAPLPPLAAFATNWLPASKKTGRETIGPAVASINRESSGRWIGVFAGSSITRYRLPKSRSFYRRGHSR